MVALVEVHVPFRVCVCSLAWLDQLNDYRPIMIKHNPDWQDRIPFSSFSFHFCTSNQICFPCLENISCIQDFVSDLFWSNSRLWANTQTHKLDLTLRFEIIKCSSWAGKKVRLHFMVPFLLSVFVGQFCLLLFAWILQVLISNVGAIKCNLYARTICMVLVLETMFSSLLMCSMNASIQSSQSVLASPRSQCDSHNCSPRANHGCVWLLLQHGSWLN